MTGSGSRLSRVSAAVEVAVVFAAMHVGLRAFMKFTALGRAEYEAGLNFSPGAAMMIATALMLVAHRRPARAWGLMVRPLGVSVNAGLVGFLIFALAGGALLVAGMDVRPAALGPGVAAVVIGAELVSIVVMLWVLQRQARTISRVPWAAGGAAILILLAAPIVMAWHRGDGVAPMALAVVWRAVGAGIGEEVFFRGYVQSRLNEAFGRPWQMLGVRFGMGLVIASLLFGLIHALNPVDYFAGSFEFAWWHGLTTALGPFGWLREKTGSVAAPAVMHGLMDVAALMV